MDAFWLKINDLLNLIFGSNFTLFERLLVIGTCFGVFVYIIGRIKGD